MTLTDLANHICTTCGMTDADDVSSAMMFLQRRLEMIWNAALWRDSLLEATLTVNPNDTTTLADSYWISERSVLLLPSAIEKVIAARLSTNRLEAASLESYYRADTDWLDYQGTPFEFQVLKPVVMEWVAAQALSASDANGIESALGAQIACNYFYSPDGVTITTGTTPTTGKIGTALQLFSFSKPATTGAVAIQTPIAVTGTTYASGILTVPATAGAIYQVLPGANESGATLTNGTQVLTLRSGTQVQFTAQGGSFTISYVNLVVPNLTYFSSGFCAPIPVTQGRQYAAVFGPNELGYALAPDESPTLQTSNVTVTAASGQFFFYGPSGDAVTGRLYPANTATINLLTTVVTLQPTDNTAPVHQRIRLTEAPTTALNLRVLGKGKCPILGPYDTAPITNVEPALLAFARGDLLLRQRQFGKAALAQQEGAALLKELIENEAFQQAGEFRIQPEGGFGSEIWRHVFPDSFNPLA